MIARLRRLVAILRAVAIMIGLVLLVPFAFLVDWTRGWFAKQLGQRHAPKIEPRPYVSAYDRPASAWRGKDKR